MSSGTRPEMHIDIMKRRKSSEMKLAVTLPFRKFDKFKKSVRYARICQCQNQPWPSHY